MAPSDTTLTDAAAREDEPARAHGRPAPGAQSPTDPDAPAGASGSPGETSTAEALDDDVRELVAVAAQRDEYLALAQRTQADFENYRKRVARDSQAAHERGVMQLARELLPVLDNLDRALEEAGADGGPAAGEEGPNQALLDGVRLVRSQLSGALARVGVEAFSPLGQPFDPTREEAITQAPAPEGVASGTVLEVYQPGYTLAESVIRPARVVVAA